MAQSTLHFAAGMAIGTAFAVPSLLQRLRARAGTAGGFLRWFALSYGLGCAAIIPSLLRHAGMADWACTAWWMNVFVFFPLIDGVRAGGILLGEAAVAALFGLQYVALLYAIRCSEHGRG